jgi:hypothetical protein
MFALWNQLYRSFSTTARVRHGGFVPWQFDRFKSAIGRTRCGELRVHLLDLRGLLFSRAVRSSICFCCASICVRFQKFVEHRVDHFVVNTRPPARIVRHQSGIHFRHFLDQANAGDELNQSPLVAVRNGIEPVEPSLASAMGLMSSL